MDLFANLKTDHLEYNLDSFFLEKKKFASFQIVYSKKKVCIRLSNISSGYYGLQRSYNRIFFGKGSKQFKKF